MRKFKLFKNFTAEEKWLSSEAQKGNILTKKGIFYKFRKKNPQNLVFGIDYRTFRKKADYQDYLTLFEDTGWIHRAGSRYSSVQYFTSNTLDIKNVSIFSDRPSSWVRYKRKAINYLTYGAILLTLLIIQQVFNQINLSLIINPKSLFLTPGLWEKTGQVFWNAFLFELPVAIIFRFIPLVLLLIMTILLILNGLWAFYTYCQSKKN